MQKHLINSFALYKESVEMGDTPVSTINSFVFVTTRNEPDLVTVFRYHNHKELDSPCLIEHTKNGVHYHHHIENGGKIHITIARDVWRALKAKGFLEAKDFAFSTYPMDEID